MYVYIYICTIKDYTLGKDKVSYFSIKKILINLFRMKKDISQQNIYLSHLPVVATPS